MDENLVAEIVRHDIRGLVLSIKSYTDLIEAGDENSREYCLRQIKYCSGQIEQILDFWKEYQCAAVVGGWHRIGDIVKNVSEEIKISVAPTTQDIQIFSGGFDCRIVNNLVQNSRRHGRATLALLRHYIDDNGNLVIIYEDDGLGVSRELKEEIFKKGFSGDSGTGYGLYFTQKVIKAIGGQIVEVGEPGKGACFKICIPAGKYKI